MAIRIFVRPLAVAFLVVLILCAFTGSADAQIVSSKSAGTTSANFLKMGVGARASALGGAFVAIADDATAGYWNPAGLPQLSHTQLVFMHNNWYQDIKSEYLGSAFPVSRVLSLGVGVSYLNYGTFEGYDSDDRSTGTYSARAFVLSTSGAIQVTDNLSLGVTGKMMYEALDQSTATGYAADFGALYRTSVFSVGVNLMNVGTGLKYETERSPLPQRLVTGIGVSTFDGRLRFATDLEMPSDRSLMLHQGVEYCYENTVFLRTGYSHDFSDAQTDASSGMSLGLGITHSIGSLDYSYLPSEQLGDIHKISFTLSFGGAGK